MKKYLTIENVILAAIATCLIVFLSVWVKLTYRLDKLDLKKVYGDTLTGVSRPPIESIDIPAEDSMLLEHSRLRSYK